MANQCGDKNWCKGLTALLTLQMASVAIFGGSIATMYGKNDAIVELTVEMRYVKEAVDRNVALLKDIDNRMGEHLIRKGEL